MMQDHMNASCDLYNELLQQNVAPELARSVLPQSMYTEFIETGSLYAYLRLCHLRMQPDAQQEIRVYAGMVFAVLTRHFPVSAPLFVQTKAEFALAVIKFVCLVLERTIQAVQ